MYYAQIYMKSDHQSKYYLTPLYKTVKETMNYYWNRLRPIYYEDVSKIYLFKMKRSRGKHGQVIGKAHSTRDADFKILEKWM